MCRSAEGAESGHTYTYTYTHTCAEALKVLKWQKPVLVSSISIRCVSLIIHIDAFTFTHVYIHRIYYSHMYTYIGYIMLKCIHTWNVIHAYMNL